MRQVVIVEDTAKDAKLAIDVFRKMGATDVQVYDNIPAAVVQLRDILEDRRQAPDVILLDLSFPNDSGFEILRLWKSNAKLQKIPVVVWTVMGDTEQKICNYFGVEKIVPKWSGARGLETALSAFGQSAGSAVQ
ncbi:MAG TPA: response regulator [Candidatus Limnocylindrales bacterium]|nr:response regulator [Candidatus Limnocylindrales bacterium]